MTHLLDGVERRRSLSPETSFNQPSQLPSPTEVQIPRETLPGPSSTTTKGMNG